MGKRNCFFNPNFQRIAKQLQNNNKVVVGKDRQEKKVSSNHMCCRGHCVTTLKNCVHVMHYNNRDIGTLGRKILLLKNEINCLPKVFGLPNE